VSSPKKSSKSKEFRLERRALRLSIITGLSLAVLGIAIGVLSGSQMILFDGFYTFLGIFLTWMAMRVSRLVEGGPTERFPFGREALVPLIIGIEGVALLATCAYASFNAITTMVRGGAAPPDVASLAYALVALVVPLYIWWQLRKVGQRSELVRAEALQWLSGAGIGLAIATAFVIARAVRGTSWAPLAHYVDPALVIAASAMFVVPPWNMVRTTFFELIEGVPDATLADTAHEALDGVATRFGLHDRRLRMTKVGRKFYAEIDFVVTPTWGVTDSDAVRLAVTEALRAIPHDLWLTIEFTTDRALLL
jgi:predicted Co/Zn/Cd cation transporter (cation efflux family)